MEKKKLQVWLPLLFAVVMILGMFIGYRLNTGGSKKGFFSTKQSNALQEALDLIRNKYVDEVSVDSLQGIAIREMTNLLDPHSVYLPPADLQKANDDLAGSFVGIGVEFNRFADTVNVLYVVPGGPSDKAGLHIGDKIIAVDDSLLTAPGTTNAYIREKIRGKSGSIARLQILRKNDILNIDVKRGSVPVPSVEAYYLTTPDIGYIKLTKFTETSYEEFMRALEELQAKGMKSLIFDLRGNGGGYMNEAVDMIDEFLDNDKLLVYTEGSNYKKREFRGKRPGLFEEGKLVILIDELSASASEVVAGSLQDWDRATIIGRRSFGKGLVQEQFGLSDGSALRLTVSRYYTPLGRSIQRSYEGGRKVYMEDLWERYSNGEVMHADSNKVANGQVYTTPKGRKVFGGGGIMPDIFVPIDTATYPAGTGRLFANGTINDFVYNYYLQHQATINQYQSPTKLAEALEDKHDLWNAFIPYAAKDSVNLQQFSPQQKASLNRRLEAQLARFKWRSTGFFEVINYDDAVMLKAIETIKTP